MCTWSILREALWGLVQRQSVNPELDYARPYLDRFRQVRQSSEFTQWLALVTDEPDVALLVSDFAEHYVPQAIRHVYIGQKR